MLRRYAIVTVVMMVTNTTATDGVAFRILSLRLISNHMALDHKSPVDLAPTFPHYELLYALCYVTISSRRHAVSLGSIVPAQSESLLTPH